MKLLYTEWAAVGLCDLEDTGPGSGHPANEPYPCDISYCPTFSSLSQLHCLRLNAIALYTVIRPIPCHRLRPSWQQKPPCNSVAESQMQPHTHIHSSIVEGDSYSVPWCRCVTGHPHKALCHIVPYILKVSHGLIIPTLHMLLQAPSYLVA